MSPENTAVLARSTLAVRRHLSRLLDLALWLDATGAQDSRAQWSAVANLHDQLRRAVAVLQDAAQTCESFELPSDNECSADILARLWQEVDRLALVAQELDRPRPQVTAQAQRSLVKRRRARLTAIAKDIGAALNDMDALRSHVDARVW
jgi:hypothetical protein